MSCIGASNAENLRNITVPRFVCVRFHISSPIAGRVFPLKSAIAISNHLLGAVCILQNLWKKFSNAAMVDIFSVSVNGFVSLHFDHNSASTQQSMTQ